VAASVSPSATTAFSGEPGTVWTNDTTVVLYQNIVAFANSCGLCIADANKIGPWWPNPRHRGCKCRQTPIFPGKKAAPFLDFWEEIQKLDVAQRNRVVGASNLLLIEAKVVRWEDVVTKTRVRDFGEVVANRGLTLADLKKAGVKHPTALREFRKVAEANEESDKSKKAAIEKARSEGLTDKQIRERIAEMLKAGTSVTKIARTPKEDEPPPEPPPVPVVPPKPPPAPAAPKPAPPKPPPEPEPAKTPQDAPGAVGPKGGVKDQPEAKVAPGSKPGPLLTKGQWKPSPGERFRSFDDDEDAIERWGQGNYFGWNSSLSRAEREAIAYYSGDGFKYVNKFFREGRSFSQKDKDAAANVEAALKKGQLPEPIVVRRAMFLSDAGIDPKSLRQGDVLPITNAPVSTTLLPNATFQGDRLEIRLPEGTRGAYLNAIGPDSKNSHEREFLVAPNSGTLRYVETKTVNFREIVVCEFVPDKASR
jgi:hypothetical protein